MLAREPHRSSAVYVVVVADTVIEFFRSGDWENWNGGNVSPIC